MRRLVVAIDYGTSNSGAAAAIVHDAEEKDQSHDISDDIEVVRDWPRGGAARDGSEKVHSDIAYNAEGQAIGYGFEACKHGVAPLQWVKLLLEPESSHAAVASQQLPRGKNPIEIVADYLRWLWKRIKAVILEKESEDEQDTDLFDPEHLTVVLTLPASWSALGKKRMLAAATMAGIPEQCLKTLAEPEAAAVYGLKKKARQRHINDGDCVIICDAGGGTVDAVAYRVRKREPLSLEQVTVSKGDFCGSSFVNREFRSQVKSILGERYEGLSEQAREKMEEEFEYDVKRTYNPLEDPGSAVQHISVQGLEDDEGLGIQNGKMKIDEAVLFASFDSVMTQIMTLIDHQIASLRALNLHLNLKGLLLVGGFGKSGFLRTRIKQEFPGRNDLKIWAADDSWTAVVRGAVACEARRAAPLIHSRLSASNYGVPFIQGGVRKVTWLVRKGQVVKRDMSTEPYNLRIDDQPWLDEDEHCLVYVPIVASSDDKPVELYSESVAPHADIKCRVPTALRFAPGSKEIRTDSPKKAWHVPATLVLYFDGAIISFRCHIKGKEVGVAAVRYFEDQQGCRTAAAIDDGVTDEKTSLEDLVRARTDSKVSSLSSAPSTGRKPSTSPAGGSQQEVHPRAAAAATLAWDKETGGPGARPPHQPHPSISSASSVSSSSTRPAHFEDHLAEKDATKKKDKKHHLHHHHHHHHFFSLNLRTKRDVPPPPSSPPRDSSAVNGYGEWWEWVGENTNRPPGPESSNRTASVSTGSGSVTIGGDGGEASQGKGKAAEKKRREKVAKGSASHWASALNG